jgi:hypothetical protein
LGRPVTRPTAKRKEAAARWLRPDPVKKVRLGQRREERSWAFGPKTKKR